MGNNEKNSIEKTIKFSELCEVLRKKGKIIGSDGKEYKPDELIVEMGKLRNSLKRLQKAGEIKTLTREAIREFIGKNKGLLALLRAITRQEGLREKVVELAINEVIERGTRH